MFALFVIKEVVMGSMKAVEQFDYGKGIEPKKRALDILGTQTRKSLT